MMKFTAGQISRFAFVYLVSEPLVFFVGRLMKLSTYQGWITLLGACLLSSLLLYLTVKLGQIHPESSWVEFGSRILGKQMHNVFLLLVLLLSIYLISLDVTNFSTFIGSMYLVETPMWLIMSLTVLCISLSTRTGLEAIIYMGEGIFLVILFSSLVTSPMMITSSNAGMMMALLTHHDLKRGVLDSFSALAWFSEWIFFLFTAPFVTFGKKLFRGLLMSLISTIVFISLFWLICLINFGPYLGQQLRYPILEVVRVARYGDFLDNLDPFLIAFWSSTMFIRSSFLLYVASVCLSKLVGFSDRRRTVFLLGSISGTFAMQYAGHTTNYEVDTRTYAVLAFVLSIELLPIYYLFVYKIRSLKVKHKNKPI
ncbi:GerAB/ArcD/ProY family transporter [Paenibacillus sp. XY044]|uniref:GerAB/ArcD/ProY family transporter n=1 Tax=Paenibacillus sp. XY044 TaxID=2026089 RepID=UPI000B986D5A|nr:GerAB/ArcD/ProY family transporter [Paenibacillus sp. XY044]OZB94933.1 hypothetical protein CJP46_14560 [Paenibacillus sp. XY044]